MKNLQPKENLTVSDTTLTTEDACFDALNIITVAGDGKSVIVEENASANFIAGQTVSILPGFKAVEGSYLHAYITTEGDFCYQASGSIVENLSLLKDSDINTNQPDRTNTDKTEKTKAASAQDQQKKDFKTYYGNGYIFINGEVEGNAIAYLTDIIGRKLGVYKLTKGDQNRIIVNGYAPGVYLLRIIHGEKNCTYKVLIK
jgi:hypothetical protein